MRKIDIGNEKIIELDEQPEPVLKWLSIDDLLIDDRYQRPLGKSNWNRIRKIAAEFRWCRFSPILVAPVEKGKYAIVDGQHRAHAAKLCQISSVPAMIVEIDAQEQARSFSWVNDQVTRISTFHIYKAALAAQDDWAIKSRDAVEAAGCRLMTSNSSTANKKVGEIYSIALVRQMVERGQDRTLTEGLKALRNYDVNGRVALYSAVILRPWLSALLENEIYLELDLVRFLNQHDPYRVLDRISKIRKESGHHGKTPAKIERQSFVALLDKFMLAEEMRKTVA
jgi:hypothetical protein